MDVAIHDILFQSFKIEGDLETSHGEQPSGVSHACEIQLDSTELLGENIRGLQRSSGLWILTDETGLAFTHDVLHVKFKIGFADHVFFLETVVQHHDG